MARPRNILSEYEKMRDDLILLPRRPLVNKSAHVGIALQLEQSWCMHFHVHVIPRYGEGEGFEISMKDNSKGLNLPAIAEEFKNNL